MPQIDSMINPNNYSIFLEKPSELSELDEWVEECITSQKRFTFSERDVLQSLWDGGEDIRLREDSRFCEVTLRTVHINEGYIPIPTKACVFYPRAKKLSSIVAVPGVWFSDASEMTVWLDTEKHQLYGPDVQDQLAFLVAGTMLEILWTASGITFNTIGVDTAITEEEVRLVDLTELAHLRAATLESYRGSLRAIMAPSNIGWSFPELYSVLCDRQQHKPNRSTIRAILSSSPEFIFVRTQNKWMLNYDITPEAGARALRKVTLIAQDISVGDDETPSITEMITKSRHRLAHLRSMYISDTRGELR